MAETIEQKTARLRKLRLEVESRRPKPIERDYPVYGMRDELKFGEHKDETIEDVLDADPGWIRWALENIGSFEVTDDVLLELLSRGN